MRTSEPSGRRRKLRHPKPEPERPRREPTGPPCVRCGHDPSLHIGDLCHGSFDSPFSEHCRCEAYVEPGPERD